MKTYNTRKNLVKKCKNMKLIYLQKIIQTLKRLKHLTLIFDKKCCVKTGMIDFTGTKHENTNLNDLAIKVTYIYQQIQTFEDLK